MMCYVVYNLGACESAVKGFCRLMSTKICKEQCALVYCHGDTYFMHLNGTCYWESILHNELLNLRMELEVCVIQAVL